MPERIPPRDELKTAILWCARMLVSYDGRPVPGPILVRVSQPEEREAKVMRPKGTLDGMEPPAWVAIGGQEADGVDVSASDLLRRFLSPDEMKLMTDLVKHQPCSASSVQERCRAVIGKSEFWAVWGQLQGRELVEEGDDKRYRVGPDWLVEWLRKKAEGRPAA